MTPSDSSPPPKVFLSGSSTDLKSQVGRAVEQALARDYVLVSPRVAPSGETASSFISAMIRDSSVVVAVVSGEISPNVATELAIATTLAKPTFLVTPSGEQMPAFLQDTHVLMFQYDPKDPAEFATRLSDGLRRAFVGEPDLPARLYERFEAVVEWLFKASGFEIYRHVVPGSQTADFLAIWKSDANLRSSTLGDALRKASPHWPAETARSRILAVDCKYSAKGLKFESIQAATQLKLSSDLAVIVTNGHVTTRAKNWSERSGVRIIEGRDLKRIAHDLEDAPGIARMRNELAKLVVDS